VATAARISEPGQRTSDKSPYPSDCNMVAITLSVYRVEPTRTTNGGTPVRTVRCLRRDGLNGAKTTFVDVWLWRDMTALADLLRPGQSITVSGKIVHVDAYLDSQGKPAATLVISAAGLSLTTPLRGQDASTAQRY